MTAEECEYTRHDTSETDAIQPRAYDGRRTIYIPITSDIFRQLLN